MSAAGNDSLRESVLNAAVEMWEEKGYAASSMRDLARRCRLSLNELYRAFPSREAIVFALYERLNDRAIARFRDQQTGAGDLAREFRRLLEIKLELLEPHRAALTAIFREAVDPESDLSPFSAASASTRERSVTLFREMLDRDGALEADAGPVAEGLWLLHLVLILLWLHDRSEGSRITRDLVERAAGVTAMLPALVAVPAVGEVAGLLATLFSSGTPAVEVVPEVTKEAVPDVDVVVVGGGPIGLLYAGWVKTMRPASRVLVLERSPTPTHKIGESTLSGFCKALRSQGISQEALQRLFYLKNGLGFLYVDDGERELTAAPEYILETFDETFQVERRPLETLMIANALRLGVEVLQGATVLLDDFTLSADRNVVTYRIGSREFRVACRLVVDATGPAGVLARRVTQYVDDDLPYQTGAVWGYFRGLRRLDTYDWPAVAQFPRDEYTQHLCFRSGWLWYIPLTSWQEAPEANLSAMCGSLLGAGDQSSRGELARRFGCPANEITSIGLVLRQDRDRELRDDPRAAFEAYARRHPAIGQLLKGGTLLEDQYGEGRTFESRLNFRRRAREMAGDGWLLVGDAAFFVDPLISPGLTGGAATAYSAARRTVAALESGRTDREALVEHETFCRQLHLALERDNQLVYGSFNHPTSLSLIQRFQEIDARRHFEVHEEAAYGEADTNVWGILDPDYASVQAELHGLAREAERQVDARVAVESQTAADYEPMVRAMQDLLADRLNDALDLTPYIRQNAASQSEAAR